MEIKLNRFNMKLLGTFKLTSFDEHKVKFNKDFFQIQKQIGKRFINSKLGIGLCLIVSLWNSFPFLFDKSTKKVVKFIKLLRKKKLDFRRTSIVTKLLNETFKNKINGEDILKQKILYNKDLLKNIEENINNNVPVIGSFELFNNESLNHAVGIFGYDDCFIYYFENSGNNYLIRAVAEKLYDKTKMGIHEINRKVMQEFSLEPYLDYKLNNPKATKEESVDFLINLIIAKRDDLQPLTGIRKDCMLMALENANLIEINYKAIKKYHLNEYLQFSKKLQIIDVLNS